MAHWQRCCMTLPPTATTVATYQTPANINSPLTYSSLAQVCKYANRVSYQVLNQHSPRLTRGLPEREDSPKSLTGIVKLSSVRRPDKAFTPHLAFITQNRLIAARRPALQLVTQIRRRAFNG